MTSDFYLCGCSVEGKKAYAYATGPKGEMLPFRDKEGYLICPEHSVRQCNWVSESYKKQSTPTNFNFQYTGPDLRDNRDPATVYAEMKAGTNGYH